MLTEEQLKAAREASAALEKDPYNFELWRQTGEKGGRVPLYPLPNEAQDYINAHCDVEATPDWGMFDRIYCIHYAPLKGREETIISELKRVGIYGRDNFEMVESVRTDYEKKIPSELTASQKNLAIGHCEMIQRAYARGYNRILILEDDIRFLKNLGLLACVLKDTPSDCDVVLYDKMCCGFPTLFYDLCKAWKINDAFCQYDTMWAASCYALNRRAMERIVLDYAEKIQVADSPTNDPNLKKAFAYVNVCCQEYLDDSQFADNSLHHHNFYRNQGIDYSLYNFQTVKADSKFPVVIVGQNRGKMTCEIIRRLIEHCKNTEIRLIVSTDRSDAECIKQIAEFLNSQPVESKILYTDTERFGLGAALNNGISDAFAESDNVLVVENDMALDRDIDIRKYLSDLNNGDIGFIDFKATEKTIDAIPHKVGTRTYLIRQERPNTQHSDPIRYGAFIANKRLLERCEIRENCSTLESEHFFIDSYKRIPISERMSYRILSVNDAELRYDSLNGKNSVFLHIGKHGEHEWTIPDGFDYLQRDTTETGAINWSKYFDRIYCVHFKPYKERKETISREMERVGILYSGVFEWWECDRKNTDEAEAKKVGMSIGYYNNRNTMYALFSEIISKKFSRVLILEDDIYFRKSIEDIRNILEGIDFRYDYIQLDKIIFDNNLDDYKEAASVVNQYGIVPRGMNNWWSSTGCISVNQKACEAWISVYRFRNNLTTDECAHFMKCTKGVTKTNIAVQDVLTDINLSIKKEEQIQYLQSYSKTGISLCEYNLPNHTVKQVKSPLVKENLPDYFARNKVLFATNGDYTEGSIWNRCKNSYAHLAKGNVYIVNPKIYGLQAFIEIFAYAIRNKYDYIIYVDCDCFIVNDQNLADEFSEFIKENAAFKGISDGGVICHRYANPMAINPFLMFARVDRIKRYFGGTSFVFDNPIKFTGWEDGGNAFESWMKSYLAYRDFRVSHPEFIVPYAMTDDYVVNGYKGPWKFNVSSKQSEPYYMIFLGMNAPDCGNRYFLGRDYPCEADTAGITTAIYHFRPDEKPDLSDDSRLICLHTWFSRYVMMGDDSKKKRIEDVISYAEALREKFQK